MSRLPASFLMMPPRLRASGISSRGRFVHLRLCVMRCDQLISRPRAAQALRRKYLYGKLS